MIIIILKEIIHDIMKEEKIPFQWVNQLFIRITRGMKNEEIKHRKNSQKSKGK